MFKQIAKNVEEKVRSSGWISLEIVTRGISYDNCNVVYKKIINGSETILRRLFTCSICYTELTIMVWEIKSFESNAFCLDEAEQYLFLQMLIEAIEKLASERKLRAVSIASDLPHVSEILINNEFDTLKTIEFIPGIKTYSGTKTLKKAVKKEEI